MLLVYLALLAQLPAPPVMPDLPAVCSLPACPCGCAESGECRCNLVKQTAPVAAQKLTNADWWRANGMPTPDEFWGARKPTLQVAAQGRWVRSCNDSSCRMVWQPAQAAAPAKPLYVPQKQRGAFLPWRR